MLTFSALVPHPPLMLPHVGGKNLARIAETVKAMRKLSDLLTKQQIDSLVIISPHGLVLPESFVVNLSLDYTAHYRDFGDLVTEFKFANDAVLAQKIKENPKVPVVYNNQTELDHGAAVPLFYLAEKIKDLSLVPISYSLLSYQDHFNFGLELQKIINETSKKIAVIASGDLSHRLTAEAPGGFSPQGNIFDEKLISLIKEKKTADILALDQNLISSAGECGLKSLIVLLGVLDGLNYEPQVLSYEGPFGVGYLTVNFNLLR